MFIHDKKNAVTVMMKKRGPSGGEVITGPSPQKPEHVMDEDREPDGRHAAMEDFLAGVHEKSPMKMAQAMANFHDIHASMMGPTKEEE